MLSPERLREASSPPVRAASAVGAATAVAAAGLYALGWDRAFSFDASRTVAHFVTAESWADVFGQDRFNNHPLLSLLDHVLFRLTGSADERLLRLVPILCGAVAVGLVAAAVARRFGAPAGAVAGATLAVNALALRHFREVRGYSLVVLAAVVATLLLLRVLAGDRRWTVAAGYGAALFVAVGTHLFALGLVAVHAAAVAGARRLDRRWLAAWAVPAAAGVGLQAPGLLDGLGTPPAYRFAPLFPLRLVANLLGGPMLPAMAVLVVAGAWAFRDRREVRWALVATAGLAGAAWLAGPSWLDSRFFVWLLPVAPVAAGAAVARRPALACVAAAGFSANLAVLGPDLAADEVPNRTAAAVVLSAQATGHDVCALGRTRAGLLAYVDDVRVVWDPLDLPDCDVAVEAAGPRAQPLLDPACRRFPWVRVLPAKHPGAAFADHRLDGEGGWQRSATAGICVSR